MIKRSSKKAVESAAMLQTILQNAVCATTNTANINTNSNLQPNLQGVVICSGSAASYKMVGSTCIQCSADFTYIPWLVFYVLIYVLCVIYLKCSERKKIDHREAEEQVDAFSEMLGTSKILISFLQIFSSMQLTMTIPWADSFLQMMNIFQVISMEI